MSLQQALKTAREAARQVVSDLPLARAQDLLDAPRRIVLMGRTSAGKSTLINQITSDARCPVGLGGVTREIVAYPRAALTWYDTPGIDDPDSALIELGTICENADGIVWVVDALQPVTSSERFVLEQLVRPGTAMWIVVAKLDLVEPPERLSVIERVRALSAAYAPLAVSGGDNRRGLLLSIDAASVPPGPATCAMLRAEILTARRALDTLPAVPDPDLLLLRLRTGVRAAVQSIDEAIAHGRFTRESEALAALGQHADTLLTELRPLARGLSLPLPVLDHPSKRAFQQIAAGLAGGGGAKRALQSSAGRWLVESECLINDWPKANMFREETQRRKALHTALDEVEGLLPTI